MRLKEVLRLLNRPAVLALICALTLAPAALLADETGESVQAADKSEKKDDSAADKKTATDPAKQQQSSEDVQPAGTEQKPAECKPKLRFNTLEDLFGAGTLDGQAWLVPQQVRVSDTAQVVWRQTPPAPPKPVKPAE